MEARCAEHLRHKELAGRLLKLAQGTNAEAGSEVDAKAVQAAFATLAQVTLDENENRIVAFRSGQRLEIKKDESLLGILESGGAFLPLDPDFPEERLRFLISDSGAAVLVVDEGRAGELGSDAARIVTLGAE